MKVSLNNNKLIELKINNLMGLIQLGLTSACCKKFKYLQLDHFHCDENGLRFQISPSHLNTKF
jgi:hypothetical protein